MSKIKIAVIGVGNIAEQHLKGYFTHPDVEVYAFCDINEEQLRKKGEKHGVTRLYTDEKKMLEEYPPMNAPLEKVLNGVPLYCPFWLVRNFGLYTRP